jgi:hypothetical protein
MGGGLRKINTTKSFSRLLLRRKDFALPSMSLILLLEEFLERKKDKVSGL